jgi:glycosyltransferase 2 family protein
MAATGSRPVWRWARRVGAGATLAVVVWRVGAGPFRDGLQAVDARALAAAAAIGVVTTVCCAWRWRIVVRAYGLQLSLPEAVAAYYRSVFLNLALPGGVVGDVHRGVRHGHDAGDVGGALRAVAWERTLGQLVQIALTVAVLLVLPSPVGSVAPFAAVALVAAAAVVLLLRRTRPVPVAARALPQIALTSTLVVVGYAVMFLIAARTAGVTAPPSRMLPLALLAMAAMVLPSVAGWGPREGGTAWVFGAAGLGAADGVTTAVVYGVMALVASLPGAIVLAAGWIPRARPQGAVDA